MGNSAEAKITSPEPMSGTFGNQSIAPVVEERTGLLKKVLSLFRRKKDQTTPPPMAETSQQKADAVQERLNEVNQGIAVGTEGGVPTGDAETIARLEGKRDDLAAVGVTANVAPVKSKMKFSTPPLPEFPKEGGKPPTAASVEDLTKEVEMLAQSDAKLEEVVPSIGETPEKAA